MKHPAGKDIRITHNRWGDLCIRTACLFFAVAGATICHAVADSPPDAMQVYLAGGISTAIAVGLLGGGAYFLQRTYVVVSGFSVDVIPLYRPRHRIRIIPWAEIASFQVRKRHLLLIKKDGSCEQIAMACMKPLHRSFLTAAVGTRLETIGKLQNKSCP